MTTTATGRAWAYVGLVLGAVVSVLANVAHSYVPPSDAAPGWSPHAGAVAGAVFWPIALLVAIEVLARVPWPPAARWTLIRFGGLVPVACVAAIVSYRHLSGLLSYYGEDGVTATVGPLAVDGLMVMATGALLATTARTVVESRDATGVKAVPGSVPVPAQSRDSTPRHAVTRAATPAPGPAAPAATPAAPVTAPTPANTGSPATPPAPAPRKPAPAGTGRSAQTEERMAYIRGELTAGRKVVAAQLDREWGTNGYAKTLVAKVRAELATHTHTTTKTAPPRGEDTTAGPAAVPVQITAESNGHAPLQGVSS